MSSESAIAFSCKDHGADAGESAPTLRGMGHDKSHANAGGQVAVAFVQNTRDEVRLFGGDGQTVVALAAEPGVKQQAYIAIQGAATRENAASGPDGVGVRTDGVAYTLEARPEVQAVAYGVRTAQTSANGHGVAEEASHTLDGANGQAVAFTRSEQSNSYAWEKPVYPTINAQVPSDTSNIQMGIRLGMVVRRLTPLECERLQGFPDGYTNVPHRGKPAADGNRYKALGNSWAIPDVKAIARRILLADAMVFDE